MKGCVSKICLLLSLCSLVLTGCASVKPYHDNPKNSYALNIMRAYGAKAIRDGKAVPTGELSSLEKTGYVLSGAHMGMSAATNLGLGSRLAGAGLGIAGMFVGTDENEEARSFLFCWMPKGTENAQQIRDLVLSQVLNAWNQASPEVSFPEGYSLKVHEKYPDQFLVDGPRCNNDDALCNYFFDLLAPAKESYFPESLGGELGWKVKISFFSASLFEGRVKTAFFPDLELYTALSRHLPGNYFIYLAPSTSIAAISMQTDQGPRFLGVPLLLNKGVAHSFVQGGL